MVGKCPTGAARLPTTSTRRSVPGDNLAIRVARVTPLYNCNSPSEPRYTHGTGMPAIDEPKRAICRCRLNGSAPDRRDGGMWSVRGSTSSNLVGMGFMPQYASGTQRKTPPAASRLRAEPPAAGADAITYFTSFLTSSSRLAIWPLRLTTLPSLPTTKIVGNT